MTFPVTANELELLAQEPGIVGVGLYGANLLVRY